MMRIAALCLAVLTSIGSPLADAQSSRTFTVFAQGKKAGTLAETVAAAGAFEVHFSYRDNGRGPDLDERWKVDAAGIPLSYESVGKSTFGAPISDVLRIEGPSATWKSVGDSGRRELAAPAFYVPVEYSPALFAQLASAAARVGGRALPILPDGGVRAERLSELNVGRPGSEMKVALYALTGLDIEPGYVWLREDAGQGLFAWTYPGWIDVIAEGYEADLKKLKDSQVDAADAQLEQLAQRLAHHYPEPVLIRNARVFDSEHGLLGPAQDVYVMHGRISAVYPTGSPARDAGTVFDAAGRVLMPGLFDMHDHETAWNAVQQLAGGVTTGRDMGNDNALLAALSKRIEEGRSLGARIVATGFIEGESPFSARLGFVVSTLDEVRQAIDWYAERGYPQLKIYNSFKPEWVSAATEYAHSRGMRVSGHIPAFMRAEEAIEQGYDEVQHVNQLLLNFFVTPATDTRTLERFNLVAENARTLDLDGARVKEFIDLLVRRKTSIDPTLAVFESPFTQLQGQVSPTFAAVESRYPIAYRRASRTNSMDVNAGNVDRYRASYAKMIEFIGRCHRAGVPIVSGTDGPAGWMLHRELELYVKAGIPANEVLQIATWNGAKYSGVLDRLGSIARGKLADLIIVDGDPTQDISAIRRIALTMKQGIVYYPSEIFAATGIEPLAPALRPLP
jgi:imidazolonepropionase-like amidohydrolase